MHNDDVIGSFILSNVHMNLVDSEHMCVCVCHMFQLYRLYA